MCSGSAPKMQKPTEPMKQAEANMSRAAGDTAREQAMKRSLASVWTRYQPAATAGKADKLGV